MAEVSLARGGLAVWNFGGLYT